MKKSFWITLLAVGMFFAGWFCRPEKGELTINEMRGRLKLAVAARLSGQDPGKENFSESGTPPLQILPINSLGELMAMTSRIRGRHNYEAAVPIMEILPRLAVTDLATVRRLIEEYADKTNSRRAPEALGVLIFRWATLQPEEAAAFSLSHPDLLENLSEWNPILIAFAAKQKPGSREKLLAYIPKEARADMEEFLDWRETANTSPAEILTDPEKLSHLVNYESSVSFSSLVGQWLRQDPDAMMRWSATLPENDRRNEARDLILGYFKDLGGDRPAMENKLSLLPADIAAEARVKWMSMLPRSEARQELMAVLNDERGGLTDRARSMAASALTDQFLVLRKFSDAAQWASTLEQGDLRSKAFGDIADKWSRKDSLAASEWVNSVPVSPERDAAAQVLTNSITESDPESALVWAKSISSEQKRDRTLNRLFRNWFSRNPSQAFQAFQNLSPEERERALPAPKTDSSR